MNAAWAGFCSSTRSADAVILPSSLLGLHVHQGHRLAIDHDVSRQLFQFVLADIWQPHLLAPAVDILQLRAAQLRDSQLQRRVLRAGQEGRVAQPSSWFFLPAFGEGPGDRLIRAVPEADGAHEPLELLLVRIDGRLGTEELKEPDVLAVGDHRTQQALGRCLFLRHPVALNLRLFLTANRENSYRAADDYQPSPPAPKDRSDSIEAQSGDRGGGPVAVHSDHASSQVGAVPNQASGAPRSSMGYSVHGYTGRAGRQGRIRRSQAAQPAKNRLRSRERAGRTTSAGQSILRGLFLLFLQCPRSVLGLQQKNQPFYLCRPRRVHEPGEKGRRPSLSLPVAAAVGPR